MILRAVPPADPEQPRKKNPWSGEFKRLDRKTEKVLPATQFIKIHGTDFPLRADWGAITSSSILGLTGHF